MLFDDGNLYGEKDEHPILFTRFGCDANINAGRRFFKIGVTSSMIW